MYIWDVQYLVVDLEFDGKGGGGKELGVWGCFEVFRGFKVEFWWG